MPPKGVTNGLVSPQTTSIYSGGDQFLFQAHDGDIASNLGVVTIHVDDPLTIPDEPPPNSPPTATILFSQEDVYAGEPVTLHGSATDPDGQSDLTRFQWDFNYDGTHFMADTQSDGEPDPTYTFPETGIYLVALQVEDTAGHIATDVATVEALGPDESLRPALLRQPGGSGPAGPQDNPPPPDDFNPVITASNSHIQVGDSVFFTASGGSNLAADWSFDYDGQHLDPSAAGLTVAHTFVGPGTYTVAADVSDDQGDEAVVTTTVTVQDVATLVVVPPPDQLADEGDTTPFDAPQVLDLAGQVDTSTVQWDLNYDGATFHADPQFDGNLTPSYQYDPGDHVAAAQFTDDCGHQNLGVSNVSVAAASPDVSAGTDMTVTVGDPVQFSGSASAPGGIAAEEWDFNYGEQTFTVEASDTLTPMHTFPEPGVYDVALRVTDNRGAASIDTITVTVNDVAPGGDVILSPTKPDGSDQDLQAGSPVYFTVSGLSYPDPDQPPSVWADWNGDGQFDVIPSDQWIDVTHNNDGSLTFFVSHTYDDAGSYPAAFRLEDAEDNQTDATAPVDIADVAPTGTFGWGDPVHTVTPDDTVSFTDVTDPSAAATEAGFTYYYGVDGGDFQDSTSPDFNLVDQAGFSPGTTHTIRAYIEDKNGGRSPVYAQTVHVQGDVVFANDGDGPVQLTWEDADGGGSIQLDAGATYAFMDEPGDVQVTLLPGGTTYVLATNGSIDGIAAASGVSGVRLEVHTDQDHDLPDPVGDGHIGAVTLPADSTLTVGSRGDFGGIIGGPGSTADELDFDNLTGPITGVRHIGTIQASGDVGIQGTVTVTDGIDALEGKKLGDITFQSDPMGPSDATNVVIGPGGQQGTLAFGHLQPLIVTLNHRDQVTGITEADGTSYRLTYRGGGQPATITQGDHTYRFVFDGDSPPDGQDVPPPLFGWIAEKVSAAVDSATTFVADVGQAVGNTIRNAFQPAAQRQGGSEGGLEKTMSF